MTIFFNFEKKYCISISMSYWSLHVKYAPALSKKCIQMHIFVSWNISSRKHAFPYAILDSTTHKKKKDSLWRRISLDMSFNSPGHFKKMKFCSMSGEKIPKRNVNYLNSGAIFSVFTIYWLCQHYKIFYDFLVWKHFDSLFTFVYP